jgi:dTMP kinase
MKSQSVFISLDGLDGSGKSTQCRLLAEWLRARGYEVTPCADPGGTAIGKIIREILLGHRGEMAMTCEALLFMASRAQLVQEIIRPALARGRIVVSDRFGLANIAYQGYAGGLEPEALRQVNHLATRGLDPDLTVVLDLPVEVTMSRRCEAADRVESRDAAYHERVRQGFLAEARRQPERIRIVDASLPAPEVHRHICEEVARVLAARSGA